MAKADKAKEPVKVEPSDVGPVPPGFVEAPKTGLDAIDETKAALDAAKLAEENAALRAENEKLKADAAEAVRVFTELRSARTKLELDLNGERARVKQLEGEIDRLRGHLTKLSEEYEKLAKAPAPKPPETAKSTAVRRAKVGLPGTHVGEIEVEIPADTPKDKEVTAAIDAAKAARGIVRFGVGPVVVFLD